MLPIDELRHLDSGPRPDETPAGAGLAVVTASVGSGAVTPAALLARAEEVMRTVVTVDREPWPDEETWAQTLPAWFVTACPPEQSPQQKEQWLSWWRTLDAKGRTHAEAEQGWSLGEWLYWLQPHERQWFWWDGDVIEDDVRATVEVSGWPAPIGALMWLLRASGATSVVVDEDLA